MVWGAGFVRRTAKYCSDFCTRCLIALVRFYQQAISPMLGKNCRYEPSCSQYFILAVKKYGPIRGGFKGFCRILRCNPFFEGGEDWP